MIYNMRNLAGQPTEKHKRLPSAVWQVTTENPMPALARLHNDEQIVRCSPRVEELARPKSFEECEMLLLDINASH